MQHSFYKKYFNFCLLSLSIILCYSNTLNSSWHFDDIPNIVTNYNNHIQEFSWTALQKSFYSPEEKKISRPVANMTFAINYLISGLDTTSYHIFNIFVHIFTSWVAYLLFLHTLQLYSSRGHEGYSDFINHDIALLGAFLWALHPIQTQAVTFIVQRMASLATLFYLLAFYFYIRFRLSEKLTGKSLFLLLATFSFLLALGTKENTVLLPLAIIGYEVAFFRSKLLLSNRYIRNGAIIFVLVCTLVFLWYFGHTVFDIFDKYSVRKFSLWERLITQPIILVRYLFLIFYPLADYLLLETDIVASKGLLTPPETLFSIIFVLVLVIYSTLFLKKYPVICYAIYYFFMNHLVESSIIPLELYFEHRNYLPSIFIFFGMSFYLIKLVDFYTSKNNLFMRNTIIFGMLVIIICEGNATFLRNEVWANEISLHSDTIEKAPENPRPYVAIAVSYIASKQYDTSLGYLRKAEKLYKRYPDRFQENWIAMIYYNAGLIFRFQNENQKAIKFFLKSIQFDPSEWQSHVNLGILYFEEKEYSLAEDFFYNAVMLHPNCPANLFNLYGRSLYANAKYDEAINIFKKGLQVKEINMLHYNLAATYLKIGSMKNARSQIMRMPYLNIDNEGAYYLYRALLFSGDERNRIIRKLVSIFVVNQYDFCDMLSTIQKNDSVDIIYPDISNIKEQINDVYQDELLRMSDIFKKRIVDSEKCIENGSRQTIETGPIKLDTVPAIPGLP